MIGIEIKIEGKSIYLDDNTSIRMELNNSFFDFDKIPSDIIYTFDVPAAKNDIVFEHARYVYVQRKKIFEAEILIGGIPFAQGKLLIQKATKKKYSIGLTVNSIPVGFGSRKLASNDSFIDDAIFAGGQPFGTIGVYTMILKSMQANSICKFPAFRWVNAYGIPSTKHPLIADIVYPNSQWGWGRQWNNNTGLWINVDYIANSWVQGGNYSFNPVSLQLSISNPDLYYINHYSNSLNLAPCIQLAYLVTRVIAEAGYRLVGDIVSDEKLSKVFYHSLRNLDFIKTLNAQPNSKGSYNYNIMEATVYLHKHVPDMTNSELLNTVFKLFGTTFYIDSQRKVIEIGLGVNIKKAKSLDLTAYCLSNESTIESDTVKRQYIFSLRCWDEKEIKEEDILTGTYFNLVNLPAASYQNLGKYAYVEMLNAFYKSVSVFDDSNDTESFEWSYYCGNVAKLRVGSEGEEMEVKPFGIIPGFAYVPNNVSHYVPELTYLPEIKDTGISKFYPTGIDTFSLILTYWYDDQEFEITNPQQGTNIFKASVCAPINKFREQDTQNDRIDFKTEGTHSLGEDYVQPYLEMLNNYENISEKFLLPLAKALEVINLLKPQELEAENQTRWVMVNNIKMLPQQINMEFTKGKEFVVCEIKLAKPIIT